MKNKNQHIIDTIYIRSRIVLLLLFILLLAGCSSSRSVSIYYSGNFHGILEDCNCPKVSDGSILNHNTFYNDSIKDHDNKLYICGGNIFSYNQGDKENKIISEIIDHLGYDFIAIGRNESGFCKDINNKVSTASLNIKELHDIYLYENKDLKIIITSLTDPSFSKYSAGSYISELDINSIRRYTDSLKSSSDLIIVVSNVESSEEKKIFNQAESIDIMISNTNSGNEALNFGNRLYVSHGQNAENMGKLQLYEYNGEIKYDNSFIKMSSDKFEDDPEMKKLTDSLKVINGIKIRNPETDY